MPLDPSTPSGLILDQDEPEPLLGNLLRWPNCFDDGHQTKKIRRWRPEFRLLKILAEPPAQEMPEND